MSIYPSTPFEEWFTGYDDSTPPIRLNHTVFNPAKTADPERLRRYDKETADLIRDLETLTANLARYRLAVAERYNELQTAPYSLCLSCTRKKDWYSKRVAYTIILTRIYGDGCEMTDLREEYPGTERRQALARFEELKRAHAGIKTLLDIQKAAWE